MSELISRKQAIEVVHKYFVDAMDKTPYKTDEDGYDIYTDMKTVNELLKHNKHISKAIKALPSVTPTEQREHGRLIDADYLLQEMFTVDEEEWTTPEIRAILENAPSVTPTVTTVERK